MESGAQISIETPYLPPGCYGAVSDGTLQQGDLLFEFPSVRVNHDFDPGAEDEVIARVQLGDLVILTQSCDLGVGKIDDVLLCNHYDFDAVQERDPNFQSWKVKEEIRRGNRPSYHLLHACDLDGYEMGIRLVNFRQLRALPIEYVLSQSGSIGRHLRLSSPYREHLSQAFARFIMRVGLPQDIPPYEKPKKDPSHQ